MATELIKKFIAALVKPRKANTDKTDFGHALLIAGNTGKMGAAILAAKACVRSGAGLTTVCVPQKEAAIIQIAVPEAMVISRENLPADFEKFSSFGVGPGMGFDKDEEETFCRIFSGKTTAAVIDADAISILAKHKEYWKILPRQTILTPHAGEFDRLFGLNKNREQRLLRAIKFTESQDCIIVLKGHETTIVSNGKYFINKTGNAGLAKGGSGDVLTGMISALLAQAYEPLDAACIAVYLHGNAADITLGKQSLESMMASDVIENIGAAFIALKK